MYLTKKINGYQMYFKYEGLLDKDAFDIESVVNYKNFKIKLVSKTRLLLHRRMRVEYEQLPSH